MEVMIPEPKLDIEGGGGPLDTRVTKHKRSRRKENLSAEGYRRVGIGFRWGLHNRSSKRKLLLSTKNSVIPYAPFTACL